jgi:hypothetical protein
MTLAERMVDNMITSRSGRGFGTSSCVRHEASVGDDPGNGVTGNPGVDL